MSGASLCITRRLARIATSRTSITDGRHRRNDVIIDLGVGVGLPIIIMILSIIVQPHRFDIVEGFGCAMPASPSFPTIFIIPLWPIVYGLISSVYGGKNSQWFYFVHVQLKLSVSLVIVLVIAIKAFLKRRLHFNTILQGQKSGLTTGHYLRLMALALSDLVITLPLAVYFLHGFLPKVKPWSSWGDVHENFGHVQVFPAASLKPGHQTHIFLPRWLAPLSALLFFSFFGLSKEACDGYRSWWKSLCSVFRKRSLLSRSSAKQL